MSETRKSGSLANRLCSQYLLFSMVGLLTFFGITLAVCHPLPQLQFVSACLMVPCSIFLLGSILFKRTVRWLSQLQDQLIAFTSDEQRVENLKPIPSTSPLAEGWNQLVSKIQQQEVWNGVERRLSETLNAQQVKRMEAIFQQLSDGIILTDDRGIIIDCNHSFANMVGVTDKQLLLGLALMDSIGRVVQSGQSMKSVEQMIFGPTHQVAELRLSDRTEDGVWRISMKRAHPDTLGQEAAVWTLRDVTQSQLAERAREQFVATATHELRTPLANIRAYAETLSTATDIQVEQQLDFFNIINNEATRLARFVDELLNVSQMEAGAITVQTHEVYLDRLLIELVEQQRPLSVEKEQTLELLIPPKLPRIRGDKDKLAGAISNLIGNAIKYTPNAGFVKVRVEYDPSQIYIHVEDNGFGIGKEDLEKLGSKFYRSNDQRVRNLSGNGLGLAFSQEVARLHGGRLTIRSEINVGSCFTLELPNG